MSEGPPARRQRALLLVGHGSHLNPESSAPVYAAATRIRATGVFDEVLEAFWKEEPALPDALELTASPEVFVVPLFLAEGYFTRQVVPRELGLSSATARHDGRVVHYCPPVGAHPGMRDLLLRRARAAIPESDHGRAKPALVIIGHGTGRALDSGGTVYRLVEQLRAAPDFDRVECGFLDEAPRIGDVLESIRNPDIVLVPYFLAEGWHTSDTIPADLDLSGPMSVVRGRRIWYTPPVGTLPEIADLALSLATDAADGSQFRAPPSEPFRSTITAAREAFLQWIRAAGGTERRMLELSIRSLGGDGYEIVHTRDQEVPAARLRSLRDRDEIRAMARLDAGGAYRPLRTTRDLQTGWVIRSYSGPELLDQVAVVYPAAVLHWYLGRTGGTRARSFSRWAARQSGRYEKLGELGRPEVEAVIDHCCGRCGRLRLWGYDSAGVPAAAETGSPTDAIVPCGEPCTIFGTRAREASDLVR